MTKETLLPDTINGTSVWHLKGVKLTNRDLLLRTDAWIHFSDFGDEGWGLMAPENQITSWVEDLATCGITIEPWSDLPYKPFGVKVFAILVCIGFISCYAISVFIIFIMPISIILITKLNAYRCKHIRFASGLKSIFAWTSIKGSHVFPNQSTQK